MTLEKYLLVRLMEERDIVQELLYIDNSVGKTEISYSNLLQIITSKKNLNIPLEHGINFITDGEIDTVFYSLLSAAPFIHKLHIDRRFVAVNKWLVGKTKEYYQNNGLEIQLDLDIDKDYQKYIDSNDLFILYGYPEFVDGCMDMFSNKNRIMIRK